MAANTGPDINTYSIPEVALGDTFNTWRDVTNTQIYKLNKMRVYEGVSSSSISVSVSSGGTLSADIADNVNKGITFIQSVSFQSGVTFNGDVTFNASTFTVNANVVTIDDYHLVLGSTADGSSDTKINNAGGGGLFIERGNSGATAEWLWRTTNVHGITGVWRANAHIGISGSTYGIVPSENGILPVHGTGIRLDGGDVTDHGLLIELTPNIVSGTTSSRSIQFERYSPSGATVFMEVFSGYTYGSRPFVNISDGANRKTINQSNSFVFGTPLRINPVNGEYIEAMASDADSAEVVGIVSKAGNPQFEITFIGEIFGDFSSVNVTSTNLEAGKVYYLAPSSLGKITPIQPTSPGTIQKAVLIATGTKSAIVVPFTGGVLQSPIQIANSSSVATRIFQFNRFSLGDVVRFKAYPTGVTLSYGVVGGTAEAFYNNGIFVKGQANTPEEAEIAGMVISVGASAASGINENFDILMDGFFSLTSISPSLVPGNVYYLSNDSAGTTGSFESTVSSLTTTPPSAEGTVRKPMLMATSALSGYLFSYRGDVRGAATGISFANLDNFLITNILSGVSGDLKIGVYNGAQAGLETVTLAAGQAKYSTSVGVTGYVGFGGQWKAMNSASVGNRILLPLDVRGEIRAGITLNATQGSNLLGRDLLISRYTSDDITTNGTTAASWNVISTRQLNSSLALGYGVRSDTSSDSWVSSVPSSVNTARSALVVGVSGAAGTPALVWKTANSSQTGLGATVTLNDTFSIVGPTASFSGFVGLGTSNPVIRLDIVNTINTQQAQIQFANTGSGGSAQIGHDLNGDMYLYETVNGKNMRIGTNNTERLRITHDGKVGIGNASPAVALDVTGEAKASTAFNAPNTPKAWAVISNGTLTAGYNVSSVSTNGGRIYVNFPAGLFPDTKYCVVCNSAFDGGAAEVGRLVAVGNNRSATQCELYCCNVGSSNVLVQTLQGTPHSVVYAVFYHL